MTAAALPSRVLSPIDALAPLVDGCYRDALVEVRRQGAPAPRGEGLAAPVRTEHFEVERAGERVRVEHSVPTALVDDDLAGLLVEELFSPGWLQGSDLFERVLTGVVLTASEGSTVPASALESWVRFYRQTLDRVEAALLVDRTSEGSSGGHGTIADYAPVYARAESLVLGDPVLELGCCFGFLSLRLAVSGHEVMATDLSTGTVRLLAQVAPRLGVALASGQADAARVALPDGSADTVLAVHLLEHLDEAHGARVLVEAARLARRRVVVAVPLEDEADATWGHVRTITLADLERWGDRLVETRAVSTYSVHEHHGGWLVLDR